MLCRMSYQYYSSLMIDHIFDRCKYAVVNLIICGITIQTAYI